METEKRSVIFVDDEPMIVKTSSFLLQKAGFEVFGFTDGFEAIDWVSEHPSYTGVVITDMTMPGITGIDVIEQIHAVNKNIWMILCSGAEYEAADQIPNLIQTVLKPFQSGKLIAILNEFFERSAH